MSEDRTGCEPKIMFRGPLPYKFEPGRQVIEVLRGRDVIATIYASDQGADAIRIVTLYRLSVERSDLQGLAGASAVKIRFAKEAGTTSAARDRPAPQNRAHPRQRKS